MVEPLAADVRGETKKEVLKKIKEEKLRLIAPMYNLDYDDLRQRHKIRRMKKVLMTSIIAAIAFFLFTIYSSIMLIKINTQQKTLKLHQALSLSQKSDEYMKKDSRYNAIKTAYQALTSFEGVKMPYTSEAEYFLSESLGIYNVGSSYKSISEINTKGVIDFIKTSDEGDYVALYDESEEITLWNSKTLKKIKTFDDVNGLSMYDYSFTFIGNDLFAYINNDKQVKVINAKNGDIIKEIKNKDILSLKGDKNGKYLCFAGDKKLFIYDVKSDKIINSIETKDSLSKDIYFSDDGKYIFAGSHKSSLNFFEDKDLTMHVIQSENGNEINNLILDANFIDGIKVKGNNAYMLLNKSKGDEYNMLVCSYNFIDNNINWLKIFNNNFGKFISRSFPENSNSIAVVNHDNINVLDADTGDVIKVFNTSSKIINIYSYYDKEMYLVFSEDGSVNYINMEYKNNISIFGKYEFNLDNYEKVTSINKGFLLIPENENRAIYYEANSNKNVKKEDIKLDYPKNEEISIKDLEIVKKKYNIKNKNMVDKIFYDTKKELMFVNYVDKSLAVYSVKDSKLLNYINDLNTVDHYFGKDKYGRVYIGDTSDSYILDKNYNKVGHIKGLAKLDNKKNRVIISNDNGVYYSLPIYTLNDLLDEAKDYLK